MELHGEPEFSVRNLIPYIVCTVLSAYLYYKYTHSADIPNTHILLHMNVCIRK